MEHREIVMASDTVKYKDKEYTSDTTPSQFSDVYEISQDGYLWYRECDHKLEKPAPGPFDPNCLTKYNCRWRVLKDYTGRFTFSDTQDTFLVIVRGGVIESVVDITV